MKKFLILLMLLSSQSPSYSFSGGGAAGWKAGVAKINITPTKLMWMAGYGNRDRRAEGTLHDLWAKALVLQDAKGRQAVLITMDICTFPKEFSDRIREALLKKRKLGKAQIMINCSHTHSGPVVMNSLFNIYPLDANEIKLIREYSDTLASKILSAVDCAFRSIKPAFLFCENGNSRFQVNRRNNNESSLLLQSELKGPNDYAVPVIKVTNEQGEITAIVFGYACHNTVLNGYQWSGDYAGFAQLEVERFHPGAIALFFQGAGADQNPLPRRSVPLAIQYGQELGYAVEKVLNEPMRSISPELAVAYSEVSLALNDPPERKALEVMSLDSAVSFKQRSAIRLLEQIDKGEAIRKSYPYPVQVWRIGDQPIFALGGELVVDYAIELKKLFGPNTFVLGYSNDVMAYIPSARVLKESNVHEDNNIFYDPVDHQKFQYEGGLDSQMEYGLPGVWKANIETVIVKETQRLAGRVGIPLFPYK